MKRNSRRIQLLAILYLALCSGPLSAHEKNHVPSDAKSRKPLAPEKCELFEVSKNEFRDGTPTIWSQQMTFSDLAAKYVKALPDAKQVLISADSDVKFFSKGEYRTKVDSSVYAEGRLSGAVDTLFSRRMRLLLAPPPFGLAPTAFLKAIVRPEDKESVQKAPLTQLHLVDSFSSDWVEILQSKKPTVGLVTTRVPEPRSLERPAPLSALPVDSNGHNFIVEFLPFAKPAIAAPELVKFVEKSIGQFKTKYAINGMSDVFTIDEKSGFSGVFVLGALANALAIEPRLKSENLMEWLRITGTQETLSFEVLGIPTINSYRLVRVIARLKALCADENFTRCEQAYRSDFVKREKILDFGEEAMALFNEGSLTLGRGISSCEEKKAAVLKIRKAVALHPSQPQYRLKLADLYRAQEFSASADYFERGRSLDFAVNDFRNWMGMSPYTSRALRVALRAKQFPITDALNAAKLSPDVEVRIGAGLASATLGDKSAIDYLTHFAKQKDWPVLAWSLASLAYEDSLLDRRGSAKPHHYVAIAKWAFEQIPSHDQNSATLLGRVSQVFAHLFHHEFLSEEENRNIIDFLEKHALSSDKVRAKVAVLCLKNFGAGHVDDSHLRKYLRLSWIKILRLGRDVESIKEITEALISHEYDQDYLWAILSRRVEELPELSNVIRDLLPKAGGAK